MTTQTAPTATATTETLGLPAGSLEFFRALAEDAGNWSGNPWFDGNVASGRSAAGFVKRLVAAGLIESGDDEGHAYAIFTDAGIEAAGKLGIDLAWINAPKAAPKAKAAKAPAAKAEPKAKAPKVAPKLPNGYEVRWVKGAFDLAKRGDGAAEDGPAWIVICTAHGTTTGAATTTEANLLGRKAARPGWCKKCAAAAK